MIISPLKAQSVLVDGKDVLSITAENGKLFLLRVRYPSLDAERLASFEGGDSSSFFRFQDEYLLSIDNAVLFSRDLTDWKKVLSLSSGNVIRSYCETPWGTIAQEYGEPPTSLYISSDGLQWKPLLSNLEVDRYSRHFHFAMYDPQSESVYATLGDGNLTRAIRVGRDLNCQPVYKGPWQFLPIVADDNAIIFGFDSAIAHSGMGFLNRDTQEWKFTFLKPKDGPSAMFMDLRRMGRSWLAVLNPPSGVVASKDLRTWNLLFENEDRWSRRNTMMSVGEHLAAFATGNRLVLAGPGDIASKLGEDCIIAPYSAYLDIVKGNLFLLEKWISGKR